MEISKSDTVVKPTENFIPDVVYDGFTRGTRESPADSEHQDALKVFKNKLNPRINIIYYPGCGLDDTPSIVFPKSKVIYIDTDDRTIRALRNQGYKAQKSRCKY